MIIVLVLLLVLGAVVVVGLRRAARTRRSSVRDDAKRVGDDGSVDPREAARRASGRSAWLRGDSGL